MGQGAPWLTRDEWMMLVRVAVLGLSVLLLVAGLLWVLGAERRAVLSMEPEKRAVLFQESFASFESLCHEDPGGALTADCRRQARFLARFPECGDACRAEVSQYIGQATR
jgi:hypothetical protein